MAAREQHTGLRFLTAGTCACLAALALAFVLAGTSQAASGTWERAWGKDVIQNGQPGDTGTGFEVCTVAADCQGFTFGALGGEMNLPFGAATDSSGNVYVADTGNSRIQKFDSSGAWDRAWGKDVVLSGEHETVADGFEICFNPAGSNPDDICLAGGFGQLGGEMRLPFGVATDSLGNVYVADTGNNRIQKFDSSGTWERAWGKNVNGGGVFGVCTVAAACQGGPFDFGSLGGEMGDPRGIATDSSGNVYVADSGNNRIQKFDSSSGNFLLAWGRDVVLSGEHETVADGFEICFNPAGSNPDDICKDGQTGGLGGELSFPQGVGTDSSGNVYVADSFNHRIQEFGSSGNFQRAWGRGVNGGGGFGVCMAAASCLAGQQGELGGEMVVPGGVATDLLGNVYVSDVGNNRIQKFGSSGTWQRAWGEDADGSNVNGPGFVFEVCTVAANCKHADVGPEACGFSEQLGGVATDSLGNLYVADGGNHWIQKFADPQVPPATAFNCGASTSTEPPVEPPVVPVVPVTTPTTPASAQTLAKKKKHKKKKKKKKTHKIEPQFTG